MSKQSQLDLPYPLVIFDWDGTLMNSMGHIVDAIKHAADDAHLPIPPDEVIIPLIGQPLLPIVEKLFPQLDAAGYFYFEEHYRRHYFQDLNYTVYLYPGVKETLKELRDRGYTLGVATNKSRRSLMDALTRTGLNEFIQLSKCAEESSSKPHPAMLFELIEEAGVDASQCLMIGDMELDLVMAANADVKALLVNYNESPIPKMAVKIDPNDVLNQLPKLINWLDQVKQDREKK